jgi:hypothetical protein
MSLTFHVEELVAAIGTTAGTAGGTVRRFGGGDRLAWLHAPTDYPALFVHPERVAQTERIAQVRQTYAFDLYYVLHRQNEASPEAALRDGAEEIAAALMAVPRLGVPCVSDSIVDGIFYDDSEADALLRKEQQEKLMARLRFLVIVFENREFTVVIPHIALFDIDTFDSIYARFGP